ncbi:MAG: tannase/feruloyl esterase family alpha/beta hydrolase [Steroidobacteraceae bacterium]
MNQSSRLALAAALLSLAAAAPAFAENCARLAALALPYTTITSAKLVPAGAFTLPPSPFGPPPGVMRATFKAMPAFCRVRATVKPTTDSDIKVEVWLPETGWNGNLDGIGNGVWAGSISYFEMVAPLAHGYAVVATDTGHVGNGLDGGFAVGHPQKLIDFGYRAVHEMTVKAKALIAAYYDRGPRFSLWTSCSTGGRQGLMEAYRYPRDYNGISAMAPANPMTDLMVQSIWTGYAALKSPASFVPRAKLAALHKAFIKACDLSDGLKDGLVADPENCAFDPKVAECRGHDGPDCLTAAQVATMREVYGGVRDPRSGRRVFPGFEPGSELQVGLLMRPPQPFPVATSYMRDLVFKNPKWDFRTFDYHRDTVLAEDAGRKVLDVPSNGLGPFFADGGKLLLSHGWSDGLIPPRNTVNFYESLLKTVDAQTAARSVRLFMIPSMQHCSGGDGPYIFEPLSVIDRWVETGKLPQRIVVSRPRGAPPMTRPLCPFPEEAEYSGHGSTRVASNFACVRVKPARTAS